MNSTFFKVSSNQKVRILWNMLIQVIIYKKNKHYNKKKMLS